MYKSPLQLPNNPSVFVSGDVTIDPSVAIGPGVILQADPDSQIVIASGVCIGMGVILHARHGMLQIESGANLGAGVLVMGSGKIGAEACIGSGTTILFDADALEEAIAPQQVIAAGSVIGDKSRQVTVSPAAEQTASASEVIDSQPTPSEPSNTPEKEASSDTSESETDSDTSEKETNLASPSTSLPAIVYGQAHLSQLLDTLLPHRRSLNNSRPDNL